MSTLNMALLSIILQLPCALHFATLSSPRMAMVVSSGWQPEANARRYLAAAHSNQDDSSRAKLHQAPSKAHDLRILPRELNMAYINIMEPYII